MLNRLQGFLAAITLLIAVSFTPASAAKIKGRITDNVLGTPVTFAALTLTQNGKAVGSSTADASGNYVLDKLAAGSYELKVSAPGYQDQFRQSIAVKATEEVTVNFGLIASNGVVAQTDSLRIRANEKSSGKIADQKSSNAKSPAALGYFGVAGTTYLWGANDGDFEQMPMNTESYDYIKDNSYKLVSNEALSTFSADVDRASYSNIRRFINGGSLPPKDAVRVEEMINYFSYNYPQPTGEDPFSISLEMAPCPWNAKHQLVHVGLQGKKIETENLPTSNLVFLIDVSGSMEEPNKLPLVKSALRLLVNELRPQDRVALVVYAGNAGQVLAPTPGNEKTKILEAIDNLEAGGSTAGGAGINLAYSVARQNFLLNGNNRVVLCTDGDFNVGVSSDAELQRLIEEKRKDGIFLSVLGFGTGNLKDSKMEQLADKGNGNYNYIDNLQEANKTLVTEIGGTLVTIAKDVKIQVEFNPAKVKAYRLVGYENRMLNKEDFNDDKKDAGEIGAGHTVTALYEIIPASSDEVVPGVDPLKYQKPVALTTAATGNEVLTIKFRYKAPKEETSKLITRTLSSTPGPAITSNDFRFAAAVAEFGMLLRSSDYKGTATYESVIAQAKAAKGDDDGSYRAEFIRIVEAAKGLATANSQASKE